MPAAKGNQNAVGHKGGGGRKTIRQEKADYDLLREMFFKPQDYGEVLKRVAVSQKTKTGKFSIWELYVAKAMSGNDNYIFKVFDRLFPETINHQGNISETLNLVSEAAKRRAEKYVNAKPRSADNSKPADVQ